MWIKTNELNEFTWEENKIPFGMTPIRQGKWAYGTLPPNTYDEMLKSVIQHARERTIEITDRDEG